MSGELIITRQICEYSISYFCMSCEYLVRKAKLEKK